MAVAGGRRSAAIFKLKIKISQSRHFAERRASSCLSLTVALLPGVPVYFFFVTSKPSNTTSTVVHLLRSTPLATHSIRHRHYHICRPVRQHSGGGAERSEKRGARGGGRRSAAPKQGQGGRGLTPTNDHQAKQSQEAAVSKRAHTNDDWATTTTTSKKQSKTQNKSKQQETLATSKKEESPPRQWYSSTTTRQQRPVVLFNYKKQVNQHHG